MMISKSYFQSLLSEASYAQLQTAKERNGTFNPKKVKIALIAEGFSPTQASDFLNQWQVVDHQLDTTSARGLPSDFA